jgi:hypothetical protein
LPDDFLADLPGSRRKVYYLMSIHEHLPPQARKGSERSGMDEGIRVGKVARRDGQHFDCATWLHKAREMPKDDFRREVEKELTGREEEPSELIYFKVYKSQVPVIEQAVETAALMLGTDKSRGYCLEMICADFLAGTWMTAIRRSCLTRFQVITGSYRASNGRRSSKICTRRHPENDSLGFCSFAA